MATGNETSLSVKHKDGWCIAKDQSDDSYRDNMPAKCGYFVVLPIGTERPMPTCPDCIDLESAKKGK